MMVKFDHGGALDRVERIYREHAQVKDIAVFGDRLGQRVALVVSEVGEDDLRGVLDEIASRSPDCACIEEFVALRPDDPLVAALFAADDPRRRDVSWGLLVGCIETLTLAGDRMSPTGERLRVPTSRCRVPHRREAHRGVG